MAQRGEDIRLEVIQNLKKSALRNVVVRNVDRVRPFLPTN